MKINNIRFKNIHSLKGEQYVSFSEGILDEAGLFAITGPTGSGKSTLLDVITLALYNRIPRINSNKITTTNLDDEGGVMTRNATDCYAEVEYAVEGGKTYRSSWSIRRTSGGNLTGKKHEIYDAETGSIIESKDAVSKNSELIGLDYDQFVRAIVLSQGQFSKLLKSNRNDRNALLEVITGATAYRKIGRETYRRKGEAVQKVKDQNNRLKGIELLSAEEKPKIENTKKELNKQEPSLKKSYDDAKEKLDIRDSLKKKTLEDNQNKKAIEEFKVKASNFKTNKTILDRHIKLVVYKDLIKSSNDLKLNFEKLEERKGIYKKKNESLLINKTALLLRVEELISKKTTDENTIELLESFRVKISKMMVSENLLNNDVLRVKTELTKHYEKLNGLGINLGEIISPAESSKIIQEKQVGIKLLIEKSGENNLESLQSKLKLLRAEQLLAIDLINSVNNYHDKKYIKIRNEQELEAGIKTEGALKVQILDLKKEIPKLKKLVEDLNKVFEEHTKHMSLEDLRSKLIDGEACSLCGSLEHPFALNEPVFNLEEENLNTKKKLLETQTHLLIQLETNYTSQIEKNKKLSLEIDQSKKVLVSELDMAFKKAVKLNWTKTDDLKALRRKQVEINEKDTLLSKSESAFRANEVIEETAILVKNWSDVVKKYNEVSQARKKIYAGENIDAVVQEISKNFTTNLTECKNLKTNIADNKKELEEISKRITETHHQIHIVLKKEGLSDLGELKKAILSEGAAEALRALQKNLQEEKVRLETSAKHLEKELGLLLKKNDESKSDEELNAFFEKATKDWTHISNQIGVLKEKLDKDKSDRERHKEGTDKLEALQKDEALWIIMDRLIGDSKGNKFSNFVQDLTLVQLIGFANKRLLELDDRYIIDMPTSEESSKKNDSLKVVDTHMGNVRRSVSTLSGGETFMLSLSMAFALSDLAAKNVNIESIFIDEGFGTLDSETLDQAITILEKMQNEGDKSIGVISHVPALKERITTQVMLEKSGNGYSSIKYKN